MTAAASAAAGLNRQRAAHGAPRPSRGSRSGKPREDVSMLARRLWLLKEKPEDVLAGKAAVLGTRGTAAVIARAVTTDINVDDATRGERRAERARMLRDVMFWMSSLSSSLSSPSSSLDTRARAPEESDAAMWEEISCSRTVFEAATRVLVSLDEAEEVLQMLDAVRGDGLDSDVGAAGNTGIREENSVGELKREEDAAERAQAHWTEDIRLEALAHLGRCDEARASLRRLEGTSPSQYCTTEDNGDTREKLVIKRYTSAIRACVHCQRSAMSLLHDLESTVMLGNTRQSKKGVATIGKDTHELIQRAEVATIDACAAAGDWETAFGILRAAQLRSFDSSPKSTWGKKKKPRKRKRKLRPVDTLDAKVGDVDGDIHGCVIDDMYLSTIRACGAGQAWQRAMSVVREAEHCGVCTPDVYSTAIRALSPPSSSASEADTSIADTTSAEAGPDVASIRERIRENLIVELETLSLVWEDDSSSSSSSSSSL